VLLDVDGVIADMTREFLKELYNELGMRAQPDDITQYEISASLGLTKSQAQQVWGAVGAGTRAATMEPYPGAVEGVKKLMGVSDVFFVTSPLKTAPRWCYDRTQWLTKHFGAAQAQRTVYTSEKYTVQGDFLVDDKPENLKLWVQDGPCRNPILWDQPWNRECKLTRLSDWGKLFEVVEAWGDVELP